MILKPYLYMCNVLPIHLQPECVDLYQNITHGLFIYVAIIYKVYARVFDSLCAYYIAVQLIDGSRATVCHPSAPSLSGTRLPARCPPMRYRG
jgi:hypothetical protein